MQHKPNVLWVLSHNGCSPHESVTAYLNRIVYVAVYNHAMAIILANDEMMVKFEKELQERLDRYQYPIQIVSAATPGKNSTLEQKIGNCARTTSEGFAGAQLHIFVESEDATTARLQAIWITKHWPTVHKKSMRFPLPINPPEDMAKA